LARVIVLKKMLFVLAALAAPAAPAAAFTCGTGAGGSCVCQGSANHCTSAALKWARTDFSWGKGKCIRMVALFEAPDAGGK
jgi:hypothetical protein